jgi:2-phosphoglycerate kinase
LATHKKKEVKAKQVILDAVKDHLIPHLSEKKTMKEMFDALVSLYQSENINKKMILWNKLRSIEMTRSNTVTSYLMKVTQIRDQLAAVGEKIADAELVNMALNGFPSFMGTICQGYLCS